MKTGCKNASKTTRYLSYSVSLLCFFVCSVSMARYPLSHPLATTGLTDRDFNDWEIVEKQKQRVNYLSKTFETLITSEASETVRTDEPQNNTGLSDILDSEQHYLTRKKILDFARLAKVAYSMAKEGADISKSDFSRCSFSTATETPWHIISFRGSKGSTAIDTAKTAINAASALSGNGTPLPNTPLSSESTVGIAALRKASQPLPHALRSYELVIALNGTITVADALTDGCVNKDTRLTPLGLGINATAHSGFVAAAKSAIPSMELAIKQLFIDAQLFHEHDIDSDLADMMVNLEKRNIHIDTVFTGHSLGGGIALPLAAYFASNTLLGTTALSDDSDLIFANAHPERLQKWFPTYVVTFGAPRVLNNFAAIEIESLIGRDHILRVVHNLDIVPRVPLASMNFAHPGLTLWVPTEIDPYQYGGTIFTETVKTAVMFAAALTDPTCAAYAFCVSLLGNAGKFITNWHSMDNYLRFTRQTLPDLDLTHSDSASELDALLLSGTASVIPTAIYYKNKSIEPTPPQKTGKTRKTRKTPKQTANDNIHKSSFSYLAGKISYLAKKTMSLLTRMKTYLSGGGR